MIEPSTRCCPKKKVKVVRVKRLQSPAVSMGENRRVGGKKRSQEVAIDNQFRKGTDILGKNSVRLGSPPAVSAR